jgi:hypothetical protein
MPYVPNSSQQLVEEQNEPQPSYPAHSPVSPEDSRWRHPPPDPTTSDTSSPTASADVVDVLSRAVVVAGAFVLALVAAYPPVLRTDLLYGFTYTSRSWLWEISRDGLLTMQWVVELTVVLVVTVLLAFAARGISSRMMRRWWARGASIIRGV